MSDNQQNTTNSLTYSVHLITAEMGGEGSPVYNHIRFRNHLGQDALAFHGIAVPRDSDGSKALRAIMAPVQNSDLPANHFRLVHDETIFEGNAEEYLYKLAVCADAANFINQQNLTYNPQDENGDSPNSVARTLLRAMDLDVPAITEQFWAPGAARIILPKNWRSAYVA